MRPLPGDVLVHQRGRLLIYRPSTRNLYAIPNPPVPRPSGGYITSAGSLVVVGSTLRSAVWATYTGQRWVSGTWRLGDGVDDVAGAGTTIVAVLGRLLGNGVDASGLAGLAVSYDGGRTWHTRKAPSGVIEPLSAVLLASGTVFVSTGSGQLIRARPGHRVVVVPGIRPVSLSRVGRRLYALSSLGKSFTRYRLEVSADGGRTWSRAPLPGGEN
jgi:hypothetical protein